MATQKQIDELMQLFMQARPRQVDDAWKQRPASTSDTEGMMGVLIYLYRTDETVTAGMISKVMHITTGRVTALTKKMVDKDLIIREKSKKDARITEIRLTDKGRKIVDDIQKERTNQMSQLIDVIGMDRLKEYIETSKEIYKILKPLSLDL